MKKSVNHKVQSIGYWFGMYSLGERLCFNLISCQNHVFPMSDVVAGSALDLMIRVGREPHIGSGTSSTMVVL